MLLLPSLVSAKVLWRGNFETGDISQWNGRPQMMAADRLKVVPSPAQEGRYALEVTVQQGDDPIDASGNRSELVRTQGNEVEGTEYFYRWTTMFAEDFPAPNTWQLFVQWHHSGSSGSPPVEFVVKDESIKLEVGGTATPAWSTPLVRGVWHEFIFHVRWSSDPDEGFVELYHNRELVLPRRSVATLFPGQHNYMKAGLYRNETITPVGRLWHDGFVQATTLEDVLPPPPPGTVTPPAGTPDAITPPPTVPWEQPPVPASPGWQPEVRGSEGAVGCNTSGATPWAAGLLLLAALTRGPRRRARR